MVLVAVTLKKNKKKEKGSPFFALGPKIYFLVHNFKNKHRKITQGGKNMLIS